MVFINPEYNMPHEINNCGTYFPYWIFPEGVKTRNPEFDDFSGMILSVKKNEDYGINYFYNFLSTMINSNIAITFVPSHNPANTTSGIRTIAQKLAQHGNVDATGCIVRTRLIDKLSNGGNRSIYVHLSSLAVQQTELIRGKKVLILDDVTTSGNSLYATKQLFEQAGASYVQCLALGQTKGW